MARTRRRFLPALRNTVNPAITRNDLKVVLGDYYSALASSGVWNAARARPWPVERAVAEGYERIIYVFRSVEAIAGQASRLPFRLKDGEDVVDDHPLYALLNHRANPLETGRQFRKRLGAQILLSKRGAFVEMTKARSGTPLRLDLLPPGRTRPVPGSNGVLIDYWETVRADGTRTEIDAENVLWFREPHPLDPYSGVTPLEAAGMSAELDFFARLYNVTFLKNDARPGGILGISGDMEDGDMDRIEAKFGRGPAEAGHMTVIAGDVSYVDSVVRPRDMAYSELATTSKTEILTAFGVPESVLGYAANRTYDNAGQEHTNFWVITMPPHLDLQATGFDEISEPELEGFFDVSKVEAFQQMEAARRAEKREEYTAGLISVDEYRVATGRDPYDVPATRCLYMPAGFTPVATSDADRKAITALQQAALPPGQQGQRPAAGGGAADPGDYDTGAGNHGGGGPGGDPAGPGPASGAATTGATGDGEVKAIPPASAPRPPVRLRLLQGVQVHAAGPGSSSGGESEPDEAARDRLEAQIAATLTALAARWTQRTAARLASPKTRKGTRHWVAAAEYKQDTRAGDQPIDAGQAVDGQRWQDEAQQAAGPVIEAAAVAAALALAGDLAPNADDHVLAAAIQAAAVQSAAAVIAMIGQAAAGLAAKTTETVTAADQAGQPIEAVTAAARDMLEHDAPVWAEGVAAQAATAATAGARDAAAQVITDNDPDMAGRDIIRVWRSRRDDKVRATHRAANGQSQPLASPFRVGSSLLRYPGDPLGPPAETYNCRCVLNHRSVRTGQYAAPPAGQITRRAAAT